MISDQSLISLFRQVLGEHWGYIRGTAGVKWAAARQKELEKAAAALQAQPAAKTYMVRITGLSRSRAEELFPVPAGVRAAEV